MACPYFLPKQRIGHAGWNPAPRLPLGDAWSGSCQAPGAEAFEPDEDSLRTFCNYGYARGRCSHFPAQAECDAIRFSVIGNEPLKILYVREKDGAPIEHGEVRDDSGDRILETQATAFRQCWAEFLQTKESAARSLSAQESQAER